MASIGVLARSWLILYNLISCFGWALIANQVILTITGDEEVWSLWKRCCHLVVGFQTMALLEVFHALIGIVRSPVHTVIMQVGSRLVVLYGFTCLASAAQIHWSLALMIGSWSFVEVPRYLFYALNLIPPFSGSKMPYFLFWLRYSLFIVLYPTGITGEILQIYLSLVSYYTMETKFQRFLHVFPYWAYIPFGPFMVLNMWKIRRSQFKKRKAELSSAMAKKVDGLSWPITNEATGERSTLETNQAAWAASISQVSADCAAAVRRARSWRFNYQKYVCRNVELALTSPENCIKIAEDGLKKLYQDFEFVRDGTVFSFSEVFDKFDGTFHTGHIVGKSDRRQSDCQILYKGEYLRGKVLEKQLASWVKNGTMESSAADSIRVLIDNPAMLDLSDRYFVLLGASSAMGPLDFLLKYGANVIAIDIDRPGVWKKLIEKTRASAGTLTFPLSKPQSTIKTDDELFEHAGGDLLRKTPELSNWVGSLYPKKQLTIGNYTYLDGALHVQLALACDAIIKRLCAQRSNTAVSFLCTPTDCHNILVNAYDAAALNYSNRPYWQRIAEIFFPLKRNVCPQVGASGLFYTDGITVNQGPNYMLAKRIQAWRAVLAYNNGHVVSSNVAPSTSTLSVTSNKLFAAAYEGFKLFQCLEVMAPETSRSAMFALLVSDICDASSVANPKSDRIGNPLQLMAYNAFHGGSFRAPYKVGSIGAVCVLYAFASRYFYIGFGVFSLLAYSVLFVIRDSVPGIPLTRIQAIFSS